MVSRPVVTALAFLSGFLASARQAFPETQSAGSTATNDCVDFQSRERLYAGAQFRVTLLRGLELRLVDQQIHWDIRVGPVDDSTVDYLWPVSPPLRTAPHRLIGAGYGMTAQRSASFERQLRFALSRAEYDEAVSVVNSDRSAGDVLRRLEQLGRGRLTLVLTDYRIRHNPVAVVDWARDVFEWITFKGRACAPKIRSPLAAMH